MGEGDGPVRLRDALADLSPRLRIGHAVEMGRLWSTWPELVGAAVAEHVEPTSLRDGVLRVRADSPTWATEIGYLREEIKRRANLFLGAEIIAEVRVWTGPGRPVRPSREDPGAPRARSTGEPARTPMEAFERARRAWIERRDRPPEGAR